MSLLEQIRDYIQSGETTKERLGLEIEHFVVDERGIQIEFHKISDLLEKIAKEIGAKTTITDGHVVGYSNDDYAITLEPACQVEISINPHSSLSEIERIYKEFLELWEPLINDIGYHFITKGNLPLVELGAITPDEIPLSPKKRYEYMDRHFEDTGKCGKYMMRASASTQISVDYKCEKDLVRKLSILEKISPVLMIMFENKKRYNSTLPGIVDKEHLFRIQQWDDLDSDRTGFLSGSLDDNYSYEKVANTAYNLPLILLTDEDKTTYVGSKSAKDLVEDGTINENELSEERSINLIEHFLSMGFFHFRVKKYIEIRVVDSLPLDRAMEYAALIKGIVYSDKNLNTLREELSDVNTIDDIQQAILRIEEDGLDAVIYNNKTAREWATLLTDLARESLNGDERNYLRNV